MLHLADAVVLFAFISSVLFIAGYTLLAKWWRSDIGWARVSLDFGLAMALSPSVLHMTFGVRVEDSVGFAWYTIGAIAFVGLVSLWNLALVATVQLKRQRRPDGGDATYRDAGTEGRYRTRRRKRRL
jgi:hypothetical protein